MVRFRQRQTNREAGRDAYRASHADHKGVEVGAVASLRVACIQSVSPAPARPALVVLQHTGHLFVDRPCLFFVGRQSLRCLDSKLVDRAIQGDQWLWLQLSSPILGAQRFVTTAVFPAGRLDDQGDLDRCLRSVDTNMKRLVTETRLSPDGDRDADRDLMDRLIGVGLGQRHPGFEDLCVPGDVSDRRLIGQLKRSGFRRWLGPAGNLSSQNYRDNVEDQRQSQAKSHRFHHLDLGSALVNRPLITRNNSSSCLCDTDSPGNLTSLTGCLFNSQTILGLQGSRRRLSFS